jgi:hypothetical protein
LADVHRGLPLAAGIGAVQEIHNQYAMKCVFLLPLSRGWGT